MYEKIKSYINRYDWAFYIIMAGIACAICWIIYGGSTDNTSTTDHLERAQEQQRKGAELNQTVTDSIERSASLNREAGERISRAQEYQQRASQSLEQGTKRLDEAERLLERNEQLIRDVEQRNQAQSSNGTTAAQTAQYVGVD